MREIETGQVLLFADFVILAKHKATGGYEGIWFECLDVMSIVAVFATQDGRPGGQPAECDWLHRSMWLIWMNKMQMKSR